MSVVQFPLRSTLSIPATTQHSGSDGGGGNMEARIAKLESDVEYIKRDIGEIKTDVKEARNDLKVDFRLLFGALIVAVLGLATLMAKGFHWIS